MNVFKNKGAVAAILKLFKNRILSTLVLLWSRELKLWLKSYAQKKAEQKKYIFKNPKLSAK